ncbi:MAG: AAA family ATPase [Candidatus Eisenbacteria bacterium]|nr:AAA family ATPase [Candidatus Eisenbacteria bacterium]
MEGEIRFMNEVFRIITGALRLDTEKVRNYSAFLAKKLEDAGEKGSADRLRKLLEETDHELRPAGVAVARAIPVDSESRFSLLERVNLKIDEPPVVLSEPQRATMNEFLSVAKSHAQLEAEGVTTSLSLILYGPPGCGKSRLARHIARELELDLYVARLDGIISSYLGSTSKNIRALFDFAARNPCVLFLDEFDAIAKLRGDVQELGELKRVVNSFIQNLDTVGRQSVILAATNHEELLDSAVWRRFAYRLELSYPDAPLRDELWRRFLRRVTFGPKALEVLVDLSEGFSGSDIEETCLRLRRLEVTARRAATLHDAFHVLQNLALGEGETRRVLSAAKGKDLGDVAALLRTRNEKLYSHAILAQLFGVSKATAFRLSRHEGAEHA